MSFLLGSLLVIVSLVGAFVVGTVIVKFVSGSPDMNWEYMIVLLIGAGLLIWPVARQASLRAGERELAQYRQILELKDLETYRLVKTGSGESLEIVKDPESGEIQLKPEAPEPKAPKSKTPDAMTSEATPEEPPVRSSQ